MNSDIIYFPATILRWTLSRWFTQFLLAMEESSLWQMARGGQHVYRFLWLGTLDPPFVIRLEIDSAGAGRLTAKVTNGQRGYWPGELVKDEMHDPSSDQMDVFWQKLNEAHYWGLPFTEDSRSGHDGSEWFIEAIKDGSTTG